MSRWLCCALLWLASPAAAEIITVEDGESFDSIDVTPGRELMVNGGRVELVNNLGSLVTINGGRVESTVTDEFNDQDGGHEPLVIVTGYEQQFGQWLDAGPRISNLQNGAAEIHGYNFRVYTSPSGPFSVAVSGIGWLLDGTIVDFEIYFRDVIERQNWQSMTLVKHDPVFVDPTGDWGFDLADLNMVRNNFGSTGDQVDGDTNFDGIVDLVDLNLVRNKFGLKYPDAMPQEWEWSGSVPTTARHHWNPTMPIPAPEPSAMALGLLASILLSATLASRRKRSLRRRDP